ncbi:BQ2448_3877 [Microbotryum intermedium]|uniref:BQ2448_3877 protein n=1 Tax=Microbotryum intermedium TaxID=269621 RepID=A0A238FEU5_9BASI|nr:BQ2448_3877 [Microbotryum intermedium]
MAAAPTCTRLIASATPRTTARGKSSSQDRTLGSAVGWRLPGGAVEVWPRLF